jgi:hypothetical protein
MMEQTGLGWLAADYHFPATYSCRLPFSSPNSALISPAPGPATVRLALIRVGVEIFGKDVVRDLLFPTIRSASVLIRPPERVAMSGQVLRAYKVVEKKRHVSYQESVVYRQMAHAEGTMTVYLELPLQERNMWETLLMNIGYWGQTSSFASCLGVQERAPLRSECIRPLEGLSERTIIRPYSSCLHSEFRDAKVTWQEVVPFDDLRTQDIRNPLKLEGICLAASSSEKRWPKHTAGANPISLDKAG